MLLSGLAAGKASVSIIPVLQLTSKKKKKKENRPFGLNKEIDSLN